MGSDITIKKINEDGMLYFKDIAAKLGVQVGEHISFVFSKDRKTATVSKVKIAVK